MNLKPTPDSAGPNMSKSFPDSFVTSGKLLYYLK